MSQSFEQANKAVHPVETQWHFPIMTKHGFVAETKERTGFVRAYVYSHPLTGAKYTVSTGVSADYWEGPAGSRGYWADLDPHLEHVARSLP
jgi:hypothetical protein